MSSAISFLRNQLFQNENQKPVLFSAMVFIAVFWSSTVLKTPAIFSLASRSKSKLRAIQIAWKRLIGLCGCLCLFTNQNDLFVSILHRIFFFLHYISSFLHQIDLKLHFSKPIRFEKFFWNKTKNQTNETKAKEVKDTLQRKKGFSWRTRVSIPVLPAC